jgi:hypothetical protein
VGGRKLCYGWKHKKEEMKVVMKDKQKKVKKEGEGK